MDICAFKLFSSEISNTSNHGGNSMDNKHIARAHSSRSRYICHNKMPYLYKAKIYLENTVKLRLLLKPP